MKKMFYSPKTMNKALCIAAVIILAAAVLWLCLQTLSPDEDGTGEPEGVTQSPDSTPSPTASHTPGASPPANNETTDPLPIESESPEPSPSAPASTSYPGGGDLDAEGKKLPSYQKPELTPLPIYQNEKEEGQ